MGYDVPAGTTLWIPMHHLHKKSTVWQDPEVGWAAEGQWTFLIVVL